MKLYSINSELYSLKEQSKINIGYNLIYLNYNKDVFTTIPIKIGLFFIHMVIEQKYYSSILRDLYNGKITINKLKGIGFILLDLEFNLLHYEREKGEDYKDYLIKQEKKRLFLNDLLEFYHFLNKKGLKTNIVINFSNFDFFDRSFLRENKKNIFFKDFNIKKSNKEDNLFLFILKQSVVFFKKINKQQIKNNILSTIKKEKDGKRKENKDFLTFFKLFLKENNRYKETILINKDKVNNTIKKELSIIIKEGFSEYFLNFFKIICFLKRNNIPFHLKGSGAGSFILYLLGINNLNPLKYKLSFNRFLGHGKIADIDIDIPGTLRERIIKKLAKEFKKENIYYILNKSSLNFNKLVIHPTGILIEKKEDIIGSIPIIKDKDKNIEISQFFDSGSEPTLEKTGFLKYDLISSKILEYIKEQLIKQEINITHFLSNWEEYIVWDNNFNNLLLNDTSYDYFQLSSKVIKGYLKQFTLSKFTDIPKLIAINRPSILRNYKRDFIINSLLNKEEPNYNDIIINNIIKDSNTGVLMIYQDQILNLLLYVLPDIPYKEITNLIKGRSSNINQHKITFTTRLKDKQIDIRDINSLWKNIEAFKDYGMNKAHSYSYALITYFELYLNNKK